MEFQHENASNLKKGQTLEHAKASANAESGSPICEAPAQIRAFARAQLGLFPSEAHMAASYKSAVLLVLIRKNRNRLDMEGLREHIDRRCLQKLKTGCFEQLYVARPRSRVAAHIRHAQGRRLGDGANNFFREATSRRIDDERVKLTEFGQLTRRVAANNLDIDVFLLNGVAQIAHARAIRFHGVHAAAALRERNSEGAHAAEQVGRNAIFIRQTKTGR